MIKIQIYISSGINNHRFLIDNEPLDPQIGIANHVHQPFDEWKSVIIGELADMCNDYFVITVHGTDEQYEYLKDLAQHCILCRGCESEREEKCLPTSPVVATDTNPSGSSAFGDAV